MSKKVIKSYSLSEMKDRLIGKVGTKERERAIRKETLKRYFKKEYQN